MFKDTLKRFKKYFRPFRQVLRSERGEVDAPPSFITTLSDDARATIPAELISDPEISKHKSVGEVLTALKKSSRPWIDSLPDDLRANPNVSKYKDPVEFVKGHLSAVESLGKKRFVEPQENSPQEEWDKYFNSIGRPEKIDDYNSHRLKI